MLLHRRSSATSRSCRWCGGSRRTCTTRAWTSASPPARRPRPARWRCSDATVLTSLSESRLIAGNQELFDAFRRPLPPDDAPPLAAAARSGRSSPPRGAGASTARRSSCWSRTSSARAAACATCSSSAGSASSATARPISTACTRRGWLTKDEQRTLRAARDFLLWLRNDLHFHAGKANDVLDRTEQLRLADAAQLSAGRRACCRSSSSCASTSSTRATVREIASHFAAGARPAAAAGAG